MPSNVRCASDNGDGNYDQDGCSHLSPVKTSFSTGASTKPETIGSTVSPGNGHILICFGPNDVGDPPMPEILEYEQQIRPEVDKRLGPGRVESTRSSAQPFPIFRCSAPLRAPSACGTRAARTRPRCGPGCTPTR